MATYSTQDGVNYNLPDEGTTFRVTGDQGDRVYKVVDGKLTTLYNRSYIANTDVNHNGQLYTAGSAIDFMPSYSELVNKGYIGTYAVSKDAFTSYFQGTGQDAMRLPEYNMADIQSVLQRTGGVLPTSNVQQTIDPNNPNGIVATDATGQVLSAPNPTPQPGALTPTPTNSVNPNVANPVTGAQAPPAGTPVSNSTPTNAQYPAQIANQDATTPTAQPTQTPGVVGPAVPIGQTPEQMQQAVQDSGQTPAPQQAPEAPYSETNPNQVINQTTGQTAGTPQINQAATQAAVSSYTGPSIVDYLNSVGQPSDYASRARLAAQMGVSNYSGTAEQNTKLLDTLRMGQGTPAPTVVTKTPTPPALPSANVNTGMLSQYGVSAPDPSQSPMLSFVDSYKQILSQFGIPDIKSQFDKVQKEYDNLQQELNDKVTDINDDPWLSEGVRIGRINKLKDRYEGKTSILTNKLKLYDSLYKQGIDEAKWVAGQAYDQYQFDQNQQIKLYELAQDQLEAQQVDTQVIDVGNRKVLINSQTGAMIKELGASSSGNIPQYQQEDAAIASAGSKLLAAKGPDGYTDPNLYASLRASSKASPTEFDNRFAYLVNPLSRAKLGLTATNAAGTEPFLSADWFKNTYTTDQLYTEAQNAGKGVGLFGNKQTAVNEYLADLEKTIQAYRTSGFSDTDILKMMK